MSKPPSRRPARGDYRKLIHLLNQNYRREWERAERLQDDLDRLCDGRLGVVGLMLRRLKRWLRPPVYDPAAGVAPAAIRLVAEHSGRAPGRVSVVIPFRDRPELLRGCLRSIRAGSTRPFEIILVDNGSREPATLHYLWRLQSRQAARVVPSPGAFNFSRVCNDGARDAAGEYLLFLNNDTEVLTPDWIDRLVRVAAAPGVGIVGATLLYPDGTIQHAGIQPRRDGRWVHAHRGRPGDDPGPRGELRQVRSVSAVTAACLLIRRDLFWSLGGFREDLPVTYGDIDLCRRVRERGLLVAVTPHARLVHFECLTRGYQRDDPGADHLAGLDDFPTEAAPPGPPGESAAA